MMRIRKTTQSKPRVRGTGNGRRTRVLTYLVAVVLLVGCFDNMFPTATYDVDCFDGQHDGYKTICQTDNRAVTWHTQGNINPGDRPGITGTILNSYQTTVLDFYEHGTPVLSGQDETDIIYQKDPDVPSGAEAFTWCNDAINIVTCDQHYIRFRTGRVIDQNIACHETGHTVGLMHGDLSFPDQPNGIKTLECMRDPLFLVTRILGKHNAGQINREY